MSPPGPHPISFDARPLTEPVNPQAVSAFVREMRARGNGGTNVGAIIAIVVVIVLLAVMLPVLGLAAVTGFRSGTPILGLLFVLIFLAAIAFGIALFFGNRHARIKRFRLSRFATANGMTYEDEVKNPPLPGMIFSLGNSRKSGELVRGHSPRFVEFGNYQYTVKSGKNSTTYHWGYVAVKLDVPLPNIVLDALGNNGFGSNLPASFRKEQQLSLEGDFDKYFTLYCPEGYEQDALYLFTPDIMARFIDNAAQLDVEIVDDWLFLYTKRAASTLDPATWAWLFTVVGALITKFDQWARWRDDRLLEEQGRAHAQAFAATPAMGQAQPGAPSLPFAPPAGMLSPPPGVAREGRRLKRSTRWLPILLVVLFGFGWFWLRILS
ncbi:hypothetical protein DC31_03750 [Microbacterium sp. CH12i]|uniref:hypothetical protein n=1 Tax=Microbacterium sp. CH12i TaxID=1479651 RepID=UPI000461BD7E|nr:hypothetical protein [Microbacterium sp. CH12i]KDA05117.1 hypothetical protein DC31_03750 [Microbacterium sp. CH12i]